MKTGNKRLKCTDNVVTSSKRLKSFDINIVEVAPQPSITTIKVENENR